MAAPCYAGFLFLDRLYQFYRFGSFFTTYLIRTIAWKTILGDQGTVVG